MGESWHAGAMFKGHPPTHAKRSAARDVNAAGNLLSPGRRASHDGITSTRRPLFLILLGLLALSTQAAEASALALAAPASTADLLPTILYLVAGASAIVGLFKMLWPKREPPVEVDIEKIRSEYARSISDCRDHCRSEYAHNLAKVEARVVAVEREIVEQTKQLNISGEARAAAIHERIGSLVKVTYRMAGKMNVNLAD